MILFEDISFSYRAGGRTVPALTSVSLSLSPGEHLAVLGANGSGKSTLVRLVNGLLYAQSGSVTVDGIDACDEGRARELRERVGIVFQRADDQIVATSVEDDVAFGPENLGLPRAELRSRVDESLAAVGLVGLERREPHLLSGGQKQRLAIAGALAMRPAYLVLDEPTSMLDPQGRVEVLAIIRELKTRGTGILHVTHDLSDVVDADRAIVLDCGQVAFEGSVADLLGHNEALSGWGLERPPIAVLAERLRSVGALASNVAATPEALSEALWR